MTDEASVAVDDTVTDEDLSKAYQEAMGAPTSPEVEVPAQTEEVTPPESTGNEDTTAKAEELKEQDAPKTQTELEKHKDDSRLGRQIKGLKAELAGIKELLERSKPAQTTSAPQEPELPDVVSTPQDVKTVVKSLEAEAKREEELQRLTMDAHASQYALSYLSTLKEMATKTQVSKEEHEMILEELLKYESPYNVTHSDKTAPVADAIANYKSVLLDLKLKGVSESKVPARTQTSAKSPVPTGNMAKASSAPVSLPKVDMATDRYIQSLRAKGVPDSEIAEMLKD